MTLFQRTQEYLLDQLGQLSPEGLIQTYENLIEVFSDGVPSREAILRSRLLRIELIRRLETGWKLGFIYDVFTIDVQQATVIIGDPNIPYVWRSLNYGNMKRNEMFLNKTHLSWTQEEGNTGTEFARSLGRYLLGRQGQRVVITFTVVRGPVVSNQQLYASSRTHQAIVLKLDDVEFPRATVEYFQGKLFSVAAEVRITPEAQAYLDILRQLDNNIYTQ